MDQGKILVLDDSKDFLFLVSSLLKFHKIKVDGASNADEALKLAAAESYALIISDYMMDDMNGLEFCRKIRERDLNRSVPMILITAKNLTPPELEELSSLSLTYIRKPIMPNELYRKITDIIGRKV
jgi:DNA-binding response OmpR family regulator